MSESLTLFSLDGLALEAEIDGDDDAAAALVLCHPHPRMGGTMRAPLLVALADEMVRRGWAVLRFNFRGIGESEGEPGTGEAEVADARGAVAFVRDRFAEVPVAIAGWSFGAAVAVRTAALDDRLGACVAIAPAVTPKEGVTAGLPSPAGFQTGVPLLLICAANDHLVARDDCAGWADAVGAKAEVMAGANHFFWGKYDDLADAVGAFLVTSATNTRKE
jgi:alpha/beta superfamily hydrolase